MRLRSGVKSNLIPEAEIQRRAPPVPIHGGSRAKKAATPGSVDEPAPVLASGPCPAMNPVTTNDTAAAGAKPGSSIQQPIGSRLEALMSLANMGAKAVDIRPPLRVTTLNRAIETSDNAVRIQVNRQSGFLRLLALDFRLQVSR